MDKKKLKSPGLLWACFINWINTLETVKELKSLPDQIKNKKRVIKRGLGE